MKKRKKMIIFEIINSSQPQGYTVRVRGGTSNVNGDYTNTQDLKRLEIRVSKRCETCSIRLYQTVPFSKKLFFYPCPPCIEIRNSTDEVFSSVELFGEQEIEDIQINQSIYLDLSSKEKPFLSYSQCNRFGILYGLTYNGGLYNVDKTQGNWRLIGNSNIGRTIAIEYDSKAGIMYGVYKDTNTGNFGTAMVNLSSGKWIPIGTQFSPGTFGPIDEIEATGQILKSSILDWSTYFSYGTNDPWIPSSLSKTMSVDGNIFSFEVVDQFGALAEVFVPTVGNVRTPLVVPFYQGDQPAVVNTLLITGNIAQLVNEQPIITNIALGESGVGLHNVSFKLFDIDGEPAANPTARKERVTITGFLNGNPVYPQLTYSMPGGVISGANNNTATSAFIASPPNGPGSNIGNLEVVFSDPIDSIIINWRIVEIANPGTSSRPGYGLYNISFDYICTSPVDLAYDSKNDVLYGTDFGQGLFTVNRTTGQWDRISNFNTNTDTYFGAIAYNRNNRLMYHNQWGGSGFSMNGLINVANSSFSNGSFTSDTGHILSQAMTYDYKLMKLYQIFDGNSGTFIVKNDGGSSLPLPLDSGLSGLSGLSYVGLVKRFRKSPKIISREILSRKIQPKGGGRKLCSPKI